MIQTALGALQGAIYQRLSADAPLMEIAEGVFDSVAEGQAFPYITIGEPNTLPLETKDTYSEEISIVIHSWSIYPGKAESYKLLNAVMQAVGKGLSIEGPFTLLKVGKPTLQVIDDVDARIKHGMARFIITIKNN